MDSTVAGGLFGLGGVALGAGLNELAARIRRRKAREEQRERERHARELVIAERLDDALVRASEFIHRASDDGLDEAYRDAHTAWAQAWVAHSPKIRHLEVRERFRAVGTILEEYTTEGRTPTHIPSIRFVGRAFANARVTLAYFIAGESECPPNAFPEPEEVITLLLEGDEKDEPGGPLEAWLEVHSLPDSHDDLGDLGVH